MNRVFIAAAWLLLGSAIAVPAAAQDLAGKVEPLLQQAREQGLRYLNSKDENAKKSAKKDLDEAEHLLKDGLKHEPQREKYWESLVATYFYQAYFGFSKSYGECLEAAGEGLQRFPANSRIIYFKGYAHYNALDYSEALKAFNRYLMAPSGNPESDAQVRQLLKASQEQFLGNWNRHANFYQSRESRIESMDPKTYQPVTVFQATRDWELELGSQGFTALTANAPKLEDPELQTYLDDLVARLLSKNPGSAFDFKVTVINSPLVNAVTPPGHIVVYSGLIGFAENEAELAAVLAHELGHNYAHHQARAGIQAMLVQGSANSLIQVLNPKSTVAKAAVSVGTNLGVMLLLRAYSRSEEKEADLYATHIMFNAGYNPTAASSFFLKMYKANPKQPIKFLSTHPPVPDRATYLTDYLESFPLDRELAIDSPAFQKLKARLTQSASGRGALPVP
jgi:tetratricopeptide (TPR) repeat protein